MQAARAAHCGQNMAWGGSSTSTREPWGTALVPRRRTWSTSLLFCLVNMNITAMTTGEVKDLHPQCLSWGSAGTLQEGASSSSLRFSARSTAQYVKAQTKWQRCPEHRGKAGENSSRNKRLSMHNAKICGPGVITELQSTVIHKTYSSVLIRISPW